MVMSLITIILTDAQCSAIECSGILEDDAPLYFPGLIVGRRMMFIDEAAEAAWSVLVALCNSEDALAEECGDSVMRNFARRACTALSNLSSKVLATA
jgi:hypothetical protein